MKTEGTEVHDPAEGLVPTWTMEQRLPRVHRCRVMLYLHGLLTESENARVLKRIAKAEDVALKANGVVG